MVPLRRRLAKWRLPSPPSRLQRGWQPSAPFPHHDPWNTGAKLRAGEFEFLSEKAFLGRPVDWEAPGQSLLWRFNLHYFHYLHLLSDREQVALCRDWIASNPVGEGAGWHPYPTSLRLVNWCRSGLAAREVLESLYRQAAYLFRTVETHVYGNHLLENARALVMAGWYLRGQGEADRWRKRGLAIYRDELGEQILSDGFHFERSPMYHALALEGILDVLNVLPRAGLLRERLREAARAMADALGAVVRPDGTIALFNDSTVEIAPPPRRLLQYAREVLDHRPRPRRTFERAGYYVEDSEDLWMMLDGGAVGPEYLMAHAHADVFSYELSFFGTCFVVDAGVYAYAPGPMRRYVRGTKAHNTVQIDGVDQVECWNSFRVARRAAPKNVSWEKADETAVFCGEFDGYRARIGDDVVHRRRVEIDGRERRVRVLDRVTGRGTHCVESRIRLHPEVGISQSENAIFLEREGRESRLEVEGGGLRREMGWYCPRFGVRHPISVLVIGGEAALPIQLAYEFRY